MKIKYLATTIIAVGIGINMLPGNAETCLQITCTSTPPIGPSDYAGCKSGKPYFRCYYNDKGNVIGPFIGCDEQGCKDGYTLTLDKNYSNQIGICHDLPSSTIAYKCESNATLCGKCESTAWNEIPSIPYATRTKKYCDGPTCKSENEVGCKKGYYGTPKSVGSGCTQCPSSGGTHGTTAAIGATAVTECYIPSGTAFSDSAGSGTYTGNCYYKN